MLRFLVLLFAALPVFAKTPVDLMLEGRYVEARAILDSTKAEPRYNLLLDAMTEPDAVRACSLYAVISQRYPHSDCDTLAQSRLQMAAAMGVPIKPIAEEKPAVESKVEPALVAVPAATATVQVAPKSAPEPVKEAPVEAVKTSETAPIPPPAAVTEPAKIEVNTSHPDNIKPLPKASVTPVEPKLVPHDKPTANPGAWFVQVGAFGNKENAYKLVTKLEKAGYGTAIVPKTVNDKELLQVRVGGYPDREACKAAAAELKSKYNLSVSLVIQ